MHDDPSYVSQLPEHPELREMAQVIETAGMIGEILDARFRCVFISSEAARAMGLSVPRCSTRQTTLLPRSGQP
jgi:hypothetical protein